MLASAFWYGWIVADGQFPVIGGPPRRRRILRWDDPAGWKARYQAFE